MINLTFSRTSISIYRWLILSAMTLVMIGFYGSLLSFGVLLKPILEEFGWTRAMASGAMSTAAGLAGLLGIVSGRLTDKYGARIVIAVGAFLCSLGYLLMIWVNSIWQLYAYFGIIVGFGFAVCWTPVNATISRWFYRKRVLALGIATSGITVGHMIVPPIVAVFISAHEWRFAYILLAAIIVVSTVPTLLMLGKDPPDAKDPTPEAERKSKEHVESGSSIRVQNWTVLEAIKTRPFQMLMVMGFVTATGFYFLAVHIVAYATDIGIDTHSAALILTFMGGANILGKLIMPQIVTKVGGRIALLILLALQALSLFFLIGAKSLWMFFFLCSTFGFGFGATSPIRMSMISEFYGLRSVGMLIGIVEISWAVGAITGPIMAGYVFDVSNSYDIALATGGVFMLVGMAAAHFIKKPSKC